VTAPVVLSMVCSQCGAVLPGLHQDVVFRCPSCGRVQELVGDAFVERQGSIAAVATPGKGRLLHLPMWALRVRAVCVWEDPERERQARLIPPLEWAYVTAFSLHGPDYFGEPGRIFTERRVRLTPGASAPLLGCVCGLEEAKGFVESHVLGIIDRRVDVTGLEMTCIIDEARLWGVPYFDEGDHLQDGIIGLRLPTVAVNDLTALRVAQEH